MSAETCAHVYVTTQNHRAYLEAIQAGQIAKDKGDPEAVRTAVVEINRQAALMLPCVRNDPHGRPHRAENGHEWWDGQDEQPEMQPLTAQDYDALREVATGRHLDEIVTAAEGIRTRALAEGYDRGYMRGQYPWTTNDEQVDPIPSGESPPTHGRNANPYRNGPALPSDVLTEAVDAIRFYRRQRAEALRVLAHLADRLDEHAYSEFSAVLDDDWSDDGPVEDLLGRA